MVININISGDYNQLIIGIGFDYKLKAIGISLLFWNLTIEFKLKNDEN